jgi:hypothetical protein
MIIDMRLPVTSSRRCEQMTAFGASDVPDVKMSAQIASRSGSSPGSTESWGRRGAEGEGAPGAERRRWVVVVGEAGRHQHRRKLAGHRLEQVLVARLGDDERAVRGHDVAEQMLVAARVVEADDRGAEQSCATEGEEVVGRVVEQHGHVAGPVDWEPLVEELGPPARLLVVPAVCPRLVGEADCEPVAVLLGVAPQQRGGVRRHQRGLAGGGNGAAAHT